MLALSPGGIIDEHRMTYYEASAYSISFSPLYEYFAAEMSSYRIVMEAPFGEPNGFVGYDNIDDFLLGGAGNDRLEGNSGDDLLDGGTESDTLFGGRGNDRLSGGLSGNDTLEGGADNDELYGGIQNDTYVYRIGDGNDFMDEQNRGGADILRIHGGGIIALNTDIKFQRDASGTLFLILKNSSGSEIGRITIANMDETGSEVETLEIVNTGITRTYNLTREGLPTEPNPDPDPPPPPPPVINHAPVITALGNGVAPGATIDVRSMFKAVDPDAGDLITEYLFVDPAGGGQLQRNGIAVAPGTIVTVSAAELQSGVLRYQGGSEGSLEAIRISAFDGQVWGAAVDSYVMSYTLPSSTTANTASVAQDDAFSVIAGRRTLIPVLANDTDANGDPLKIVSLAGHDPRLVSIAPDGRSLIIDVPASMNWPFRFTYYVSDGRGGQSEANATITVNPASNTNNAPAAFDLSRTGQAGSDLIIDLLQAVKDPDLGETLTVTWVGNPSSGTLTRNGSIITYRPATGYVGTDSVNFSVIDSRGAVNTFALSLTINGGVEAVDDFVSAEFNQAVTFNPLTNDRDDGALFVQNVSLVQHGSVAINADGTLTYTPTSGFVGTDRFRYLASDGSGGSQEAFITIAVRAANGTGGTITGSEGDDPALVGTPVGEVILGLGGNDVISPGAGNDNVDGGADFDTVDYSSSPAGVVIDASDTPFITQNGTEIPDESQDGFGSIDLIKNIEGINGSAWNDRLVGGDRLNSITGGTGDDEILGSYSESQIGDEIDGGGGNDIINLSILNNRVYGGSGNDQILGGIPGSTNGVPNLPWSTANNWVDAGDGNDRVVLWGTGNTVFGGEGNDTIRTGGYVDAGAGDDVVTEYATSNFSVQFANDEWHLGAGNDRAVSSIGADRVFGDDGDDTIIYERPVGVADPGADFFDGGSGFDTFRFSLSAADSPTRVFIDLAAGFARFSDGTYFQVTNFERFDEWFGDADVLGSARADEVRVADGNGVIEGRGGADRLIASSGGFTFVGGAGADFIDPGLDSSTNNGARFWGTVDRIVYNSVFDAGDQIAATFATGSGGDVVAVAGLLSSIGYGGSTPFADGYLRLIASANGAEFQVDTDGTGARETWTTLATFADDAFSFTAANFDVGEAPIVGDTGGSTSASAFHVGVLDGSLRLIDAWVGPQDAADRLAFHINSAVDLDFDFEVLGNNTEIRLFDSTGALRASMVPEVGTGNGFTLRLDPGAYNLSVVQISGATDVNWRTQSGVVSEGLIITGSTLAEIIRGTALNDTLIGRAGIDTLDGGAGNDFVHYFFSPAAVSVNLLTGTATGGEGTDTLLSIEGIVGSSFADALRGSNGTNNLRGERGNDRIEGNGGNDVINGGAGIDMIIGGSGRDTMTGGADRDVFDFNVRTETGISSTTRDVIVDFQHLVDDINFRDIDASTLLVGNNNFVWRGTGSFTTSAAGEIRFVKYNNPGTANDYTIIFGDTDGDTASEFQIQLRGLINLTSADFVL
jgi:Ca2+-binding RTX toxin-like protein